jgi:hypothetical protein
MGIAGTPRDPQVSEQLISDPSALSTLLCVLNIGTKLPNAVHSFIFKQEIGLKRAKSQPSPNFDPEPIYSI